jgi:hypothetical protein
VPKADEGSFFAGVHASTTITPHPHSASLRVTLSPRLRARRGWLGWESSEVEFVDDATPNPIESPSPLRRGEKVPKADEGSFSPVCMRARRSPLTRTPLRSVSPSPRVFARGEGGSVGRVARLNSRMTQRQTQSRVLLPSAEGRRCRRRMRGLFASICVARLGRQRVPD